MFSRYGVFSCDPAQLGGTQLRRITLVRLAVLLPSLCIAQVAPPPPKAKPGPQDDFQRHFAAARTFQVSGDQERAAVEYRAFLGGALRSSAKASYELGEMGRAGSLFEQALAIAPEDPETRLDYAQMLFQQEKLSEARDLAEKVLSKNPDQARAQLILGQVLFAQKDYRAAREHLEAAVVAAPTFDSGYLLGITYIKLGDFPRARLVFDDLITGFGDTVRMHMMFGMAYKEGGWEALDNAIAELKKALAKDSQAQKAHFLIALAYIDRDGESAFAQAADELRAELKINPQDSRAHYLLGYIAMKQRDAKTAEAELLRSAQIDPRNPDPLIYLGQIYSDSDRDAEAEAMLRKAIALSANSSSNDYLIGRAHYVLGRLVLKSGKREEGEKELALSQQIRDKMNRPDAARDAKSKTDPELASMSEHAPTGGPAAPPTVPAQTAEGMKAYLKELTPAIADAYNNLGVFEASQKNFKTAAEYFRRAGEWSPALETLDRNWGMASFYAADYQDAVAPLTRQLEKHPDDIRVRAALGLSLFTVQNFAGTLETLKPIQSEVDDDPGLGYAFAVSLVKTGEYDEGVRRLKAMADANPNSADIHLMLGSAFADQHEYDTALQEYRKSLAIDPAQMQGHYLSGLSLIRSGHPKEAVEELRTALKLSPSDVSTKYHLAFSLIQVQEKDEAKILLQEVIQQDPKYADAYYQLGKLQLDQGDSKAAVASLENGTKANPDSDYIHYQLAMAYRRESRTADAERELKLYQTLKNRNRGRGDAPQTD
ncbi:MAG TPA: tetratricopeptide repeat protein [Terriglobales bacterium]|jgi:tetratricopeptide (TPR) repeat protein|nr:tetratricopeptide repeat protein [Terriglobales bacterium]